MSLALISGLLVVFAAPAFAEDPPSMFLPDDDNTNISDSRVLSDRFDGTDSQTHLTVVATSDTDRVDFYACPVAVGATVEQAELPQCNVLIGTDSTPNTPLAGTTLNPADEAYDVFWDIPNNLDLNFRHIVGLACIGAGTTLPPSSNPNCRQTVEENILLDDAAGGTSGQTTTGEMVSYCTADTAANGGPSNGGANPCEVGATTVNTTQRAAVDARFKPFHHGDAIPNDGVVIRATTSPDIAGALSGTGGATNPASLFLALDFGADANNDPQTNDSGRYCNIIDDKTTFKLWECAVTSAALVAQPNSELAVWIEEDDPAPAGAPDGEGACAGDAVGGAMSATGPSECTLDSHYSATVARSATTVKQSWTPGGGHTHSPPSPPSNAGCQAGETETDTHSNSQLGDVELGELCMSDQFTDPFAGGAYTEELTAPGNLDACSNGNQRHDHDGDGRFEHCHGVTDAAGLAQFQVSNFNATVGTTTLTSCFEGEVETAAGSTPPARTDHGCTDEAAGVKDTLTLQWGTLPTQVFLAFTDPAPVNPADPCRTGITFKRNNVADTETLIACTYDSNGNPVPTDQSGARLQWTITDATDEGTAVRFNGSPPQETTGANATTTVQIVAEQQGDNFIDVTLLGANGNFVDDFFVEKQVEGENVAQRVATNVTAKKGTRRIRGAAKTPGNAECRDNRDVSLFKRVRGPNRLIGTDVTNDRGRYGIAVPKPRRGTYYVKVSQTTRTDPNNGNTLNCLSGQSDDVRYRRRR
jgi:hypothetical protein